MRKSLLVLSTLLLSLSWAAAQDTPTQSNPNQTSPSQAAPDKSQAIPTPDQTTPETAAGQTTPTGTGGETTVHGCLSSSNGNFTLTDKSGNSYQLMGDASTLTEHVGHEVKVTGTTSSGDSAGSAMGQGAASAQQTIQVTSLKHISKNCKSGAANMAH